MWMKLIGAAMGVFGWSALASAQFLNPYGQPGFGGGYPGSGGTGGGFPGGGGGGFMPNIYNPQTQPLSPYLNMSRGGGNPAANYYFGTRPGTVGGGGGFGGAPNIATGGNRPLFPFQITPEELPPLSEPAEGYVLPPAGHPVVFSNTLGFYPSPFGNNRGGTRPGTGSNRPGGQPGATPRR